MTLARLQSAGALALAGLLIAGALWKFDDPWRSGWLMVFTGILAGLAVYDWRTGRLPLNLTLPALALTLVIAPTLHGNLREPWLSAAGMWLLGTVLWRLRVMGGGDRWLMAMIGALVGFPGVVHIGAFALLLTGILARVRGRDALPLAPGLVAGAVALLYLA